VGVNNPEVSKEKAAVNIQQGQQVASRVDPTPQGRNDNDLEAARPGLGQQAASGPSGGPVRRVTS